MRRDTRTFDKTLSACGWSNRTPVYPNPVPSKGVVEPWVTFLWTRRLNLRFGIVGKIYSRDPLPGWGSWAETSYTLIPHSIYPHFFFTIFLLPGVFWFLGQPSAVPMVSPQPISNIDLFSGLVVNSSKLLRVHSLMLSSFFSCTFVSLSAACVRLCFKGRWKEREKLVMWAKSKHLNCVFLAYFDFLFPFPNCSSTSQLRSNSCPEHTKIQCPQTKLWVCEQLFDWSVSYIREFILTYSVTMKKK